MIQIEVLLASSSSLKSLIHSICNNLKVIELSDTKLCALTVNLMPELIHISIQGTMIKYLDLHFN